VSNLKPCPFCDNTAAEKLNISRSTLNNRLFRSKWTIEKSLTRSVNK